MRADADRVLEGAYRILSERDWWQSKRPPMSEPVAVGAVCVLGAVGLAFDSLGLKWRSNPLLLTVCDRVSVAAGGTRSFDLADWNDDPHTTKEDVLLALKRARYDFDGSAS